jgi:hypothetical protein
MIFETNDIYWAGYLQAVGFAMQSNHTEGSKTIFCYNQTDKLKTLVEDYYNMKATVNPMHFGTAPKNLKNIVYQKNNQYNCDNHSRKTY